MEPMLVHRHMRNTSATWSSSSSSSSPLLQLPTAVLRLLQSMLNNILSSSITRFQTVGSNSPLVNMAPIHRSMEHMHNHQLSLATKHKAKAKATGILIQAGTHVVLKASHTRQLLHQLACRQHCKPLRWHQFHHLVPFSLLFNLRHRKHSPRRRPTPWLLRRRYLLILSIALAIVNSTAMVATLIAEALMVLLSRHLHPSSRHKCRRNLWVASAVTRPASTLSTWNSLFDMVHDRTSMDTKMDIRCHHTWMVPTMDLRISVL